MADATSKPVGFDGVGTSGSDLMPIGSIENVMTEQSQDTNRIDEITLGSETKNITTEQSQGRNPFDEVSSLGSETKNVTIVIEQSQGRNPFDEVISLGSETKNVTIEQSQGTNPFEEISLGSETKSASSGLGEQYVDNMPGIEDVASSKDHTHYSESVSRQQDTPVVVFKNDPEVSVKPSPTENNVMPSSRWNSCSSRDRCGLNSAVVVELSEVLGEPDIPGQTPDKVWDASNVCFTFWQKACYKSLGVLCAVPLGAYHGCHYGMLAFRHTWCLTPKLRACKIMLRMLGQYWGACVHCACDPCALICRQCRRGGK